MLEPGKWQIKFAQIHWICSNTAHLEKVCQVPCLTPDSVATYPHSYIAHQNVNITGDMVRYFFKVLIHWTDCKLIFLFMDLFITGLSA